MNDAIAGPGFAPHAWRGRRRRRDRRRNVRARRARRAHRSPVRRHPERDPRRRADRADSADVLTGSFFCFFDTGKLQTGLGGRDGVTIADRLAALPRAISPRDRPRGRDERRMKTLRMDSRAAHASTRHRRRAPSPFPANAHPSRRHRARRFRAADERATPRTRIARRHMVRQKHSRRSAEARTRCAEASRRADASRASNEARAPVPFARSRRFV